METAARRRGGRARHRDLPVAPAPPGSDNRAGDR